MKINQTIVKTISTTLREFGDRQEIEDGVEVYLTEDITAAFGPNEAGKTVFQGLSFEMVGRDFHVLPNLDLVISETTGDEDSEDEVYVVEDEHFAAMTAKYLQWRAEFLSTLNV